MVFIVVQMFVAIGNAVLQIVSFNIMRVWLENAYSRTFGRGFGDKNEESGTFCSFIPLQDWHWD